MPSEQRLTPPRFAWLRSQELGVLCGQSTVLLLGVGSVVLAATRDGASAAVHFDDVTAFFAPPRWTHWWFYALLVVLAVYALNTALCTFDAVRARLRHKVRELSSWAPTFLHVGFLVALAAHLVGGVWTVDRPPVLVRGEWSALGDGREARLIGLEQDFTGAGHAKLVRASLEVRDAAGGVRQRAVGYNEPLSDGAGADLWLLDEAGALGGALRFSAGPFTCATRPGLPCVLGPLRLEVIGVEALGGPARASVRVRSAEGTQSLTLPEGGQAALAGGQVLRFDRSTLEQAVQLRGRRAPGNPLLLVAAVVMVVGLVLMGRRWL